MTDSVGFSHNFNPVNGTCHDAKDHEDNISLVDDLIFNNKLVTYIRKENELYRDNTIIENNITFSSSFNPLIANESTETEKSLSSEIANSVLVDSRLKEYTLAEISQIQLEFNQTMYGKRTFHIAWTAYVFSLTIFGGLLIFAVNDLSFIDCWFSATSATVNGGLTVKGPDDLTKPTFAILAFLMFFGSSAVMLLPTLLFRCHQLRALRPAMEARLRDRSLCPEDREVILDHILWYQASVCTAVIIATYILFWIFFGTVFLYVSMCSQERTAQLSRRGISNFQDALYLSLSAFTNSGLSLTDNLVYLSNNHGALATLSLLILAGNTLMPVLLRFCIKKIYQLTNTSFTINILGHERCGLLRACLAYVLKSPRKICTYIFLGHDTSYLLQFALVSTAVEYFIFIVSTLHRRDLQGVYGDRSDLARLGIFQVINTRHAGFGLIDFRLLSQELIFVTAVMMFLSPVPYIGLLQKTTVMYEKDKQAEENKKSKLASVLKRVFQRVWFLRFLVIVCIARSENVYMTRHPEEVNLWYIMVELISAFGMVGASMGVPGKPFSLVGRFTSGGKLLVLLTFLMGKNRAMPKMSDTVIDFHFEKLRMALYPSILRDIEAHTGRGRIENGHGEGI